MRRLELNPEEVLVPGEYEVGNERMLKIYWNIFNRDGGSLIHPVTILPVGLMSKDERENFYENDIKSCLSWLHNQVPAAMKPVLDSESIDSVMEKLEEAKNSKFGGYKPQDVERDIKRYQDTVSNFERKIEDSPFFLIDGNHRSIAAALNYKKIPSIEIQNDSDLETILKMVNDGELIDFPHDEENVKDIYQNFLEYVIGRSGGEAKPFMSVKERVDKLTLNGDLPDYMKEKYLGARK